MSAYNLALRFGLELAALGGWAVLGWGLVAGPLRWLTAGVAVVAVATLWGVFAVPGDPSRSGNAPVPVPGAFRLALELAVLLGGALALHYGGFTRGAVLIAILCAVHCALSWNRLLWLVQQ